DFIRKYLCEALDWHKLGYEIAGTFRNVSETIEFVKKNEVDVVISDIRMTSKSGIDLAEYLFKNYPEIKIIFISGYKKFEYAQKAISYNVFDYLIKPLTYSKLHDTMEQLGKVLDKAKMEPSAELFKQMRRHFFADVMMGVYVNKADAEEYITKTGLNVDADKELCCTIKVYLKNLEEFFSQYWQHGIERLHNAINSLFLVEEPPIYIYITDYRYDRLEIVATGQFDDPEQFKIKLIYKMEHAVKQMKDMLKLESEYKIGMLTKGIEGILAWSIKNGLEKDIPSRRRHLIISLLLSGNIEASRSLFTSTLSEFKNSTDMLKIFADELESIYTVGQSGTRNDALGSDETAAERLQASFERAVEFVSNSDVKLYNKLIQKSVEYITENYHKDISLEDVAAYIALSPVYFSRYFKRETGEKFIDYVSRLKIEKAAALLRQTEYKVQDVCSMVGYRSVQHFCKLFKLYTGHTPSAYRSNSAKELNK
ncbi:MAG: helix-turn-helix domain-containing protein, partial [Bacillota bacterium]|nr:helix-turn-helix domain-containing protein [Bacillota bacterium]